jgi:hypothetical protein
MDNITFQQHVVFSAIAKGAHALIELTSACAGLYPLELQEVLNELITLKKVCQSANGFYLTREEAINIAHPFVPCIQGIYDVDLPEPHPHDYDWRFDGPTIRKIAEKVLQENVLQGPVLALGAPSVFIELVYTQNTPPLTLMDWSSALIDYLRQYRFPEMFELVAHDVLSEHVWSSKQSFDVAIIDPPWYTEYYAAFLAQVSSVTHIGARLLVSLLPPNTKPSAPDERWMIFETAQKLGWHLRSLDSGGAQYQMPLFEQASLHLTQLDIAENWRAGDLAIFDKVFHPPIEVIQSVVSAARCQAGDQQEWTETFIGRYKIKLRGPFQDYQDKPELLSIEPGDTLPTVSRRYKGRESIDLWLWNNQVFAVKGKAAFLAALFVLSNQPLPESLQRVSTKHLELALALLLYKTQVGDFQIDDVWKGNRHGRKYAFASQGVHRGTGTS